MIYYTQPFLKKNCNFPISGLDKSAIKRTPAAIHFLLAKTQQIVFFRYLLSTNPISCFFYHFHSK